MDMCFGCDVSDPRPSLQASSDPFEVFDREAPFTALSFQLRHAILPHVPLRVSPRVLARVGLSIAVLCCLQGGAGQPKAKMKLVQAIRDAQAAEDRKAWLPLPF